MAGRLLKKVVRVKLALTGLVALAGSTIVAFAGRDSPIVLALGLVIVAVAPILSYIVILKIYGKRIREA